MRVNRLKNYYRRYKANFISKEVLEDVLKDAIDNLSDFTATFNQNRSQLREFKGDKMKLVEDHLFSALKNLKSNKYEAAIKEIKSGKKVRDQMRTAYIHIRKYNYARELLKKIKLEIDEQWLKQLRTIRIFEDQVDKIGQAIKESKYIQARVLASYCIGEIDEINENQAITQDDKLVLDERIEFLKKICSDTQKWSRYCLVRQLSIEEKIERLLHYLIDQGRWKLVNRLIDDLEEVLSERKQFRDLTAVENEQTMNATEIKKALRENSWSGGVNAILLNQTHWIKKGIDNISKF